MHTPLVQATQWSVKIAAGLSTPMSTIVRSDALSIRSAIPEFAAIGAQVDRWATLAWSDIKLRYRRTTLGPLWITLGLGASVFSVGLHRACRQRDVAGSGLLYRVLAGAG
jgi:hypothetical protein